jgi:ABC-type sugar transport system substrate-binding protein
MRWRVALSSVVITASLLAPGSPASAASARHHGATATIAFTTQSPYAFYGKVTSGPDPCVVGRKVQLLQGPPGSQEVAATDTTSSNGDWYVTVDNPQAGHYQAKVFEKTYKAHGKLHVCDAARSPGVENT